MRVLLWTPVAATLALLAGGAAAQSDLTVHVAFAADRQGAAPPALAWLRHQVLAARPEWPTGRSPAAPFTAHRTDGRTWFGESLPLPPDLTFAGEATLDGVTVQFACANDGTETWEIDGGEVPQQLAPLLESLHLWPDGVPRTLDLAAVLGNLAGAAVDGDTTASLLALGAAQCGELVLAIDGSAPHLRARGRSGGGLLLPAMLLFAALQRDGGGTPVGDDAAWRLRAFGSRDGDRAEAARQLQRVGAASLPALRALLHADEPSRLSAIDGLLRLRAAGELPRIVAAAEAPMPLATAMARTAVLELWPLASAATRVATLSALQRSDVLDASIVPAIAPPAVPADPRYRWFGVLTMVFTGLLGLWMRERALRA